MMIMIDPMFAHWITISPIVLAVIVGIIARRVRYREEVRECIKWSKKSVHPLITKGSKKEFLDAE